MHIAMEKSRMFEEATHQTQWGIVNHGLMTRDHGYGCSQQPLFLNSIFHDSASNLHLQWTSHSFLHVPVFPMCFFPTFIL